jgi:hypothetical protein
MEGNESKEVEDELNQVILQVKLQNENIKTLQSDYNLLNCTLKTNELVDDIKDMESNIQSIELKIKSVHTTLKRIDPKDKQIIEAEYSNKQKICKERKGIVRNTT